MQKRHRKTKSSQEIKHTLSTIESLLYICRISEINSYYYFVASTLFLIYSIHSPEHRLTKPCAIVMPNSSLSSFQS